MKSFASTFCEDADFVNVAGGALWKGRNGIETRHALAHELLQFKASVLQIEKDQVKLVVPEVAIVHALSNMS
jgi:uncharacterized protein (TIGR02246 family)